MGNQNNYLGAIFERYLHDLGYHEFEKLPVSDLPTPDYLVHTPYGDIICEAKEFEATDTDKQAMEGGRVQGFDYLGAINPRKKIRYKIEESIDQFKRYSDYPCLLILHSKRVTVPVGRSEIEDAMYGDLSLQFPVVVGNTNLGPAPQIDLNENMSVIHGRNAATRFNHNTELSAVGHLIAWKVDKRTGGIYAVVDFDSLKDFEIIQYRFDLVHNKYANKILDNRIFPTAQTQ